MSVKAAGLVAERGYKNIKVFREGIDGWDRSGYDLERDNALPPCKIKKITPEKLKEIRYSVFIVDIRPQFLHKRGDIRDSLKMPMEDLSRRYSEIPRNKPVIIVDHAEQQAAIAVKFLKSKDYKDVSLLKGGLMPLIFKGVSF
jgi:rhodanese-related sulfurtransferase